MLRAQLVKHHELQPGTNRREATDRGACRWMSSEWAAGSSVHSDLGYLGSQEALQLPGCIGY